MFKELKLPTIKCEGKNNTIRKASIQSCFKRVRAKIKSSRQRQILNVYWYVRLALFKGFLINLLLVKEQSFYRQIQTFVFFFKYKSQNAYFLLKIDVKQLELNGKPYLNPKH